MHTKEELAAVCVLFNPFDYNSHKIKYHNFEKYIHWCGVKLITVEIQFDGRPFEHTDRENPDHVQLRTNCVLWHKERGLNIGIQHLKRRYPEIKKFAWLDDDIRFANPNWVHDTLYALDHFCIVQPFSQACNLNPKYESMWVCDSRFRFFIDKRGFHQHPPKSMEYVAGGHPGLAWAARMDVIDNLGGLLDIGVTGSGDTYMANAFMGDIIFNSKPGMSEGMKRALLRYQEKCNEFVKRNVGYVPGLCTHYWHGAGSVRGYDKRWDIACFHKYDPHEDIKLDANGLYTWTGNKKELEFDLRRSTMSRNEDSIDEKY